ncbi:MAG TPA: alpha-ribazole phosphatase [Clostridiaceae bacterium]|nr:alpha-ribazole phosphatase [Clostridiaceae bacterium]
MRNRQHGCVSGGIQVDIVMVRHGMTECNIKGIYAGKTDFPLSSEGIGEIYALKEKLKDEDFDKVYVSPLKRALQTAQILGFKGEVDERISEVDFGLFEGLTYKEIEKKYPKDCGKWKNDCIDFKFPEGESLSDVYKRTCEFIDDIPKAYKKVLVITHGGVIKCALCSIFDRIDYFFNFASEYGKCTVINIEGGFKYIKSINK